MAMQQASLASTVLFIQTIMLYYTSCCGLTRGIIVDFFHFYFLEMLVCLCSYKINEILSKAIQTISYKCRILNVLLLFDLNVFYGFL